MLVEYEYELLSYMASKSISKSDDVIFVPFNYIKGIDSNVDIYLKKLENTGILEVNKNGVDIKISEWISLFLKLINQEFQKYNTDVRTYYNKDKNLLIFNINKTEVNFNIIIKKDSKIYREDCIFMSLLNLEVGDIYWMDLLNDHNKFSMFYMYLNKEVSRLNIDKYKSINIFEGIEETHISEIFNVTLRKYFKNKNKSIIPIDLEIKSIIKNVIKKDELNYFGIDYGKYVLLIVKDNRIIKFISIKDSQIIFSKEVDETIEDINTKLINKVSEFRKLNMFKDNKIIENSGKLTDGAIKLFLPITIAFNILGLSKFITVNSIKQYKYLPYILAGILLILQVYIVALIYVPAYKLSKFRWEI